MQSKGYEKKDITQVVGFTVQGSRLTSMQYGVAFGKNRMNSSFILKLKPNTLD